MKYIIFLHKRSYSQVAAYELVAFNSDVLISDIFEIRDNF